MTSERKNWNLMISEKKNGRLLALKIWWTAKEKIEIWTKYNFDNKQSAKKS